MYGLYRVTYSDAVIVPDVVCAEGPPDVAESGSVERLDDKALRRKARRLRADVSLTRAVLAVRRATGAGLKEALLFVDNLAG